MSSSSEARVVRGTTATGAAGLTMPELRAGQWTRLGDDRVLGDAVTEQVLDSLAESTRLAARSQGYAVGWAEGRRAAERDARQVADAERLQAGAAEHRRELEHRAAVAALESAAQQLHDGLGALYARVGEQASELAFELAQVLVGEGGRTHLPDPHVVRRVLAALPDEPVVRVRLSPEVAAAAGALTDRGVAVVADPTLGAADALVETHDHVVDLRVSTALDRLREVLA